MIIVPFPCVYNTMIGDYIKKFLTNWLFILYLTLDKLLSKITHTDWISQITQAKLPLVCENFKLQPYTNPYTSWIFISNYDTDNN